MPIRPSVWPGRWCSVMPWQKSNVRSSNVFQLLYESQPCLCEASPSFDLQIELHVMLQIHANVCSCGNRPECRSKLQVMYPNFDILVQRLTLIADASCPGMDGLCEVLLTFLSKKRSRPPAWSRCKCPIMIFLTSSTLWPVASIWASSSCFGSYLTLAKISDTCGPQTCVADKD